ncbi:P-loop containing nucleoside triphosphate hydrolase protein [Perkinsela sp. CCAP 1560/4]|nr:P-loop containing nucleoside triphosphate hydrolase protein [Perkinsela sp. CCAP 1560/4]|eukprot:KNH09503.1 P-loop containing nucleoside triphosphate hydrolase protein [Perkinsela sp. CCAP 1560/4]
MLNVSFRLLRVHWSQEEFFTLRRKLEEAFQQYQRFVVVGNPGVGKSLAVPFLLSKLISANRNRLEGKIMVLQPNEAYCKTISLEIAQTFGLIHGKDVGYTTDDEENYDKTTKIFFSTSSHALKAMISKEQGSVFQGCHFVFDEAHKYNPSYDMLHAWLIKNRPEQRHIFISSSVEEQLKSHFSIPQECTSINVPDAWVHTTREKGAVSRKTVYMNNCALEWLSDDMRTRLSNHARNAVPIENRDLEYVCEILIAWGQNTKSHLSANALIYLPSISDVRILHKKLVASPASDLFQIRLIVEGEIPPEDTGVVYLSPSTLHSSFPLPSLSLVIDFGTESNLNARREVDWNSHETLMQKRIHCGRTCIGTVIHLFDKRVLKYASGSSTPQSVLLGETRVLEEIFTSLYHENFQKQDIEEFLKCFPMPVKASAVEDYLKYLVRLGVLNHNRQNYPEISSYSWTKLGDIFHSTRLEIHLCRLVELAINFGLANILTIGVLVCGLFEESQFHTVDMVRMGSLNLDSEDLHWDIFLIYERFLHCLANSSSQSEDSNANYFLCSKRRCVSLLNRVILLLSNEVTTTTRKKVELLQQAIQFCQSSGHQDQNVPNFLRLSHSTRKKISVLLIMAFSHDESLWIVGTPAFGRRFVDSDHSTSMKLAHPSETIPRIIVLPYPSTCSVARDTCHHDTLCRHVASLSPSLHSFISKVSLSPDCGFATILLERPGTTLLAKTRRGDDCPKNAFSEYHKKSQCWSITHNQVIPCPPITAAEMSQISLYSIQNKTMHTMDTELDMLSKCTFYPFSFQWRSVSHKFALPSFMSTCTQKTSSNNDTVPMLGFFGKMAMVGSVPIFSVVQLVDCSRTTIDIMIAAWRGRLRFLVDNSLTQVKAVSFGGNSSRRCFVFEYCSTVSEMKDLLKQRLFLQNPQCGSALPRNLLTRALKKYSVTKIDGRQVKANVKCVHEELWRWMPLECFEKLQPMHYFRETCCCDESGILLSNKFSTPILHTLYDNLITKRSQERFINQFLVRLCKRLETKQNHNRTQVKNSSENLFRDFCATLRQYLAGKVDQCSIAFEENLISTDYDFSIRFEGVNLTWRSLAEVWTPLSNGEISQGYKSTHSTETDILNVLLLQFILASVHCSVIPKYGPVTPFQSHLTLKYSNILHRQVCQEKSCSGCYSVEQFWHGVEGWVVHIPNVLPSHIFILPS